MQLEEDHRVDGGPTLLLVAVPHQVTNVRAAAIADDVLYLLLDGVYLLEPVAAYYAATFAAGGHRKLWVLFQADGYRVSMSSVARALGRRGLLLPQRYQAERRQLARVRRAVFLDPPTRRCRVWQSDFSEFETTGGGTWRLSGVVDYVAKVALACPVTTTPDRC